MYIAYNVDVTIVSSLSQPSYVHRSSTSCSTTLLREFTEFPLTKLRLVSGNVVPQKVFYVLIRFSTPIAFICKLRLRFRMPNVVNTLIGLAMLFKIYRVILYVQSYILYIYIALYMLRRGQYIYIYMYIQYIYIYINVFSTRSQTNFKTLPNLMKTFSI